MRDLDGVVVDTDRGTVRVGAGATWKVVLEALHPAGALSGRDAGHRHPQRRRHRLGERARRRLPHRQPRVHRPLARHGHGGRRGAPRQPQRRPRAVPRRHRRLRAVRRDRRGRAGHGARRGLPLRAAPGRRGRCRPGLRGRGGPGRGRADDVRPPVDLARQLPGRGHPLHLPPRRRPRCHGAPAARRTRTRGSRGWCSTSPATAVSRSAPSGPRSGTCSRRLRRCETSRNAALRAAEACLVSRNQGLYNSLGLLDNDLAQFTDVLHEYFLPPDELAAFLAEARAELPRPRRPAAQRARSDRWSGARPCSAMRPRTGCRSCSTSASG